MKTFPSTTSSKPALFKGFPYTLTHLAGCLYHVILLPQADGRPTTDQIESVRYQTQHNNLSTWLVVSDQEALLFQAGLDLPAVVPVPRPRSILFGKLLPQEVIPETKEILIRYLNLSLHADSLQGDGPPLFVSDPFKGGRLACAVELVALAGRQPNGVPKGLRQCPTCGDWHGLCLDTRLERFLVVVHCRCQNDNRCARCGQLLYDRKLGSNYFSEPDASVCYVPGFSAIKHRCPQAVESWATQPFISLKTAMSMDSLGGGTAARDINIHDSRAERTSYEQ